MDYAAQPNLPAMFLDQAARLGARPFLRARRAGVWQGPSYTQAAAQMADLARGLLALGIGPGDRVAIVAQNSPEWVVADLAIMAIGAISVPGYTTNTADDHLYMLDHSGARAVIVGDGALAHHVLPAARSAEGCETVIMIADAPADHLAAGLVVHSLAEVQALGAARQGDITAMARAIGREDTACFIYTSGTGGRPKAVMLSHRAILANCLSAWHLLASEGVGDEIFLSLLPLSHSFEHTIGLFFPISIGAQVYYAEGPDQLAANLAEVRPTIMTAVPRLYEALHNRIRRGVAREGGRKAQLFEAALRLGRKRLEGRLSLPERAQDLALDLTVRRKVAQRFGGRLKAFVSGGAPLDPEVGQFFLALGVRLLQGYGQTEAAPVISANPPGRIRIETVGPPLHGVELKIAGDGEILVRGDMLMTGYWRDEEATARTLAGGWLHTGDIGRIEPDGYLSITDRKKDIIVNSGGDNIAPARIEGRLALAPEIAQAMVYGDKRPWLSAVLVPDEAFLAEYARAHGVPSDLAALAGDPGFGKALGAAVERVNAGLAPVERIRRFVIATAPFSPENKMLTPTLKTRRHAVRAAYFEALDALYGR